MKTGKTTNDDSMMLNSSSLPNSLICAIELVVHKDCYVSGLNLPVLNRRRHGSMHQRKLTISMLSSSRSGIVRDTFDRLRGTAVVHGDTSCLPVPIRESHNEDEQEASQAPRINLQACRKR